MSPPESAGSEDSAPTRASRRCCRTPAPCGPPGLESPGRSQGYPASRKNYPVGAGPKNVALGGGSVWTANAFDGTISRIHPGSGKTTTIPVGGTPNDLTFANGLIWVTID